MSEGKELNYMAIDKEGKFVAAASPTMPSRDLAKELAKWIRWGCSVERCSNEFVRQKFGKVVGKSEFGERV